MSLKVEREHRMEPPTQALYMEKGQVDTWMGSRKRRKGGTGEGRRKRGVESGRKQNQNAPLNWGHKSKP